jgi:REP element-mobilizing transposase RayT
MQTISRGTQWREAIVPTRTCVHAAIMDAIHGHKRLRSGRCSLAGQTYFVTTTTIGRRPLFADRRIANVVCRRVASPGTWGDAELLCWVLMPDHWHGLVTLGRRDPLGVVVNRFKARVTKTVREMAPAVGPVWARAFHDHALRAEEDLLDVARYIVLNPVRAGIAARVMDYPYWNAVWL